MNLRHVNGRLDSDCRDSRLSLQRRQQPTVLQPALFPAPWGVPEPAMAFLSSAVAVPSLVLGTLLEAGELPDFGALPLSPTPSPANSAALARSGVVAA